MKTKSAVILTVHDAPNMSAKGRRSIVSWLERQIGFIKNHSKELGPRFTARYLYEAK